MLDVECMIKAQRIVCLKSYVEYCASPWKIVLHYYLRNIGGKFILRLRLHERGFISIRYFETASKSMRFVRVYTEPFSYSLGHAEVITEQRDLGTKKASTILFFSAWRRVDLCSPGLTTKPNSF